MKKLWLKVCCLILVAALMVNSLPMTAFAEQFQNGQVQLPATSETDELVNAEIIEELVDNRTEFTKEFLLSNGLTMAVVYNSAVHYENDGQWEDIDNTLQLKTDGTITNTAGVWDVSFPQQLTGNNLITITKDGYELSFAMSGELRQQGNLEVMNVDDGAALQSVGSGSQSITIEKAVVDETISEVTDHEETVPEETVPEETVPEETVPEETVPEETIPEETVPEETDPEETVPEETVPEETVPEETVPEETVPEETVPEETIPEETVPEETIPKETIPEETIPVNIPALEDVSQTESVVIDGKAQTFSLNSAKTSQGQIQLIDHTQALKEAEYEETILTKTVSQLRYANVYTNADIQYDLKGNRLKESVILNSYDSKLRGYRYTLNVGELVPVLNEDGSIYFYDKAQENIVMSMPAPFLMDDEMATSYDVQVSLTKNNDTYTLIYLLPQTWLASEDRAWPVILDPVVQADLKDVNTHDITVMSGKPTVSDHLRGMLQVGYSNNDGKSHVYIRFDQLPQLTTSDVIINAQLSLVNYSNGSAVVPTTVHKVTEWWDVEGLCWNNKPDYNSKIEDYAIITTSGQYSWDVTDIAREWYAGINTGMMLKATDDIEESEISSNWKEFFSSDFGDTYDPVLTIIYRNNNGLESYWDYTSVSAGRAGNGYLHQYTGNLVWVHDDLGFGGNRMPVSISHIYNTNDSNISYYGLGNGWRTNFNQYVFENNGYYVWDDADGTCHYFISEDGVYREDGEYEDEDGLELTLSFGQTSTESYLITDKYGNTSYFDTYGRLTKQQNNQATKSNINITYRSGGSSLIQRITDGAGRKYIFDYNSSDLLRSITYVGTGSDEITSISYDYTSGNLTSITYMDNEKTNFYYTSNNLLTYVEDVDGYGLEFGYTTVATELPNRVNMVAEYDGNTEGGAFVVEYNHNQTTFTDHNGNIQVVQFNDMGNTISVQDGEGHAQYAQYAKNDVDSPEKGNQLTASSKMQNTVANLLPDSSFENNTLWTAAAGSRSIASSGYIGSKSLKVIGGRVNSSSYTLYSGESITFSAYVKAPGSGAELALYSGNSRLSKQAIPATNEWTRVEVSYTNTDSSSKAVSAALKCASGQTVYMDCVQLEKFPTASRYNLIQNGDFSESDPSGSPAKYWTETGDSSDISSNPERIFTTYLAAPQLDGYILQMDGTLDSTKVIRQTVPVSGDEGDTFVVSGWASADSVPLISEDREFGIRLKFNYENEPSATAQFNSDVGSEVEWQYAAAVAVAEQAYSSVTVELVYDYNANTAWFDGIQLYKEQFSQSYTYDDNGNIISVVDLQKQETQYEYNENNDLIKITELANSNTPKIQTYEYDEHHNVTQATTDAGVVYKFTYDEFGNNTSVEIVSGGTSIISTAEYFESNTLLEGNFMVSSTDATGNITYYGYDENTNVLDWVQYPNDSESTRTEYTYDNMYRMTAAEATTNTNLDLSANYTYTDDQLTSLVTPSTTYSFSYGDFALRSSVNIGSTTLANYTYTPYDNYLDTLDYGNGDKVEYDYDNLGRVTNQTYEDGETVDYYYNNDGALAKVIDSETGIATTYQYDFIDRMMKYTETGNSYTHSVGYEYDTINNLTQIVETIGDDECSTSYTYDNDNRVTSVTSGNTTDGFTTKNYTYDAYGRVSELETKYNGNTITTEIFTYNDSATSSANTTAQIATHTIVTDSFTREFAYTYDNNGNITSISDDDWMVYFDYDSANQMIKESNSISNRIWEYTYDDAGNMKSYQSYEYSTQKPRSHYDYSHTDSEWGDLLTSFYGETVSYDEIGNPTSDYEWEYTWQHGRQLAAMSKSGENWTFTYNADGIRTQRTNGSTTYNYVYNGDKLSRMTVGSDQLDFTYDAAGNPMSVTYNGTTYYYLTNIQGDVIAILDSSGEAVVEYYYDAWGFAQGEYGSMEYTLGALNPLRYRGYVYDQEYGFYYLQSRYYNPEIGRFINADKFAATGQGLLGNNMFVYCDNNPIMGYDPSGLVNWGGVAVGIGLALLAVATVVATVVTAGAASPLVATVATAVGTAVSAALAESAITTTIGAIKEDPIVYDLTITCGNQRNGCSLVYDYGTNVSDVYLHDGKTSNGAYGTSYGTGFVYNYDNPGDYGGTFYDASVSSNYKNADLGIDFCTDPSNLQSGFSKGGGSYAFLLTSGLSTPAPGKQRIITYGVDYYWQVCVF